MTAHSNRASARFTIANWRQTRQAGSNRIWPSARVCRRTACHESRHAALHKRSGRADVADGFARLHVAADSAARKAVDAAVDGPAVFPLARALMTAAASIMVIGAAWLVEIPRSARPQVAQPHAIEADWEKIAGGKIVLPRSISNETGLANLESNSRFSNWMVNSLKLDGGL